MVRNFKMQSFEHEQAPCLFIKTLNKELLASFLLFFSIFRLVEKLWNWQKFYEVAAIAGLPGDINKYQFIFITVRMEHYLKMVNISDLFQRGCNNIQLVLFGNRKKINNSRDESGGNITFRQVDCEEEQRIGKLVKIPKEPEIFQYKIAFTTWPSYLWQSGIIEPEVFCKYWQDQTKK